MYCVETPTYARSMIFPVNEFRLGSAADVQLLGRDPDRDRTGMAV